MADSVREKILKNLQTTLKTINGTAPFLTDLKNRVYRYSILPKSLDSTPAILIGEPAESFEWLETAFDYQTVLMTVPLVAFFDTEPESTSKSGSNKVSDLIQDIQRAIYTDQTRGGNSIMNIMSSNRAEVTNFDRPFEAISMDITIHYRMKAGDPTVPV